jgi:hypothetical protein
VAGAVIYLVSNVAAMVTGDCIRVDGAVKSSLGMTSLKSVPICHLVRRNFFPPSLRLCSLAHCIRQPGRS